MASESTGQRPSYLRQVFDMIAFTTYMEALSPEAFEINFGPDMQDAFPGNSNAIRTGQAIPVLICALDEMKKNNIGKTLLALALQEDIRLQPIVVDNASTDGTGEFARRMGAIVIPEGRPGLILALRAGFQYLQEQGYSGPILHTDADAVPLQCWAKTLVDEAYAYFPEGGEGFGSIMYYDVDRRLFSPTNLIHTALAKGREQIRRVLQKDPVAHGPNGVIMADQKGKILDALSQIENPAGIPYVTDIVVEQTVKEAGGRLVACRDLHATTEISGRRVKNMGEMALRIFAPSIAARRAYASWK